MLSITPWWPAGQTVLILGAGGGVGIAAVQIAKVGRSMLQHSAGYMERPMPVPGCCKELSGTGASRQGESKARLGRAAIF